MIQFQIEDLEHGPTQLTREQASDLLRSTAARVFAIANLNRQLASANGSHIELRMLLASTRSDLLASFGAASRVEVRENLEGGCLVSGEQASVMCLVMNEIVVNALKHARPPRCPLVLTVNCAVSDDKVVVELADDGVGLPVDFDESRQGRVGFKLIRGLLLRVGAELQIEPAAPGLKFRITLAKA